MVAIFVVRIPERIGRPAAAWSSISEMSPDQLRFPGARDHENPEQRVAVADLSLREDEGGRCCRTSRSV
jgi:hypothetical protein